jgi:predicted AlkP superfamily pyrophosphatase or phosphodiesterase
MPYNLQDMYDANDAGVIRSTPFGNNLLADFAKKAIESENLGKDNITDFLAVSFSSTDYIGHVLGPRSIELQDTYAFYKGEWKSSYSSELKNSYLYNFILLTQMRKCLLDQNRK